MIYFGYNIKIEERNFVGSMDADEIRGLAQNIKVKSGGL